MELKHRHSNLLVGYWRGLQAGHKLPQETEVDADIMRCLLPNILVAEAEQLGGINVRVCGTEARSRFGYSRPDWSFLYSIALCDRARVREGFLESARSGDPLQLSLMAETEGGVWADFECVFVPVGGNEKSKLGFIGAHIPLSAAKDWPIVGAQTVLSMELIRPAPVDQLGQQYRKPFGRRHLRLVTTQGD